MRRFPALLASLFLLTAALLGCSSTWYPTDEDPVYTDGDGVTWGWSVDGVDPDMLLTQGDDGVVGYINVEESDAAVWRADMEYAYIPGSHDVYVTINLYEFLTYEVIGTDTFLTHAEVEAEAPGQGGNSWFPEHADDVSTTDDGRTWGANLVGSSCDMLYVIASDTGAHGFISASELEKAEGETMMEVAQGGETATVMLDVFLYGTDTVVGQYAVTSYA